MSFYVGIDAGGTKTAFACFDEGGNCLNTVTLGTCHILQVSRQEAVSVLQTGLAAVCADRRDVIISAGIAGYGRDAKMRSAIEDICAEAFAGRPYYLHSDAEIALYGALRGKDGILLIAGTGSIALRKLGKEIARCGGWGYILGDEGSAYWIGCRLLQAFTRQWDGRLAETPLKDAVLDYFQITDGYQLISLVRNDRTATAGLAKLGSSLLDRDPVCQDIFRRAARELALLCNTLSAAFRGPCPLALTGGLWHSGPFFHASFASCLDPKIHILDTGGTPLEGAYFIAKEGKDNELHL